jgi:hypothetical protein
MYVWSDFWLMVERFVAAFTGDGSCFVTAFVGEFYSECGS